MSSASAPQARMPLVARIVGGLFLLATLVSLALVVHVGLRVGAMAEDGSLSPDERALGVMLCVAHGLLAAVYAAAGWQFWTGRNWSLAALFTFAALFGFPFGTAIGVVGLGVLFLPRVRAAFLR